MAEQERQRPPVQGGIVETRPVPDPTALTTDQINRAIGALRELIEARLDGMDKAIELLQTATDKMPASIKASIGQLQELHEEKFRSIALQFTERDTRTDQMSRDSKVAVDAALQAAKEAVGEQNKSSALAIAKSEASMTKQIDQIGTFIASTNKGVDDKIDDIKGRLTIIEGMALGGSKSLGTASSLIAAVGVIVGILIAIGGVIVAVVTRQ